MRREHALRLVRRVAAAGLAVAGCVVGWNLIARPDAVAAPPAAKTEKQPLFDTWPAGKQPDLVLVLTGQTYGYLQKCGCSNPQKGGLDRRYNFIASLKAKGWDVIALDVGDVPKPSPYTPTREQTLTKYDTAMQAMKLMGYKAVGVGREELSLGLLNATSKYTLQAGNEFPRVHSVNISNPEEFPGAAGSTITPSDVLTSAKGLGIGVLSVAGAEVTQSNPDRTVKFTGNAAAPVTGVLKSWKTGKDPEVKVMLYQGPLDWINPDTKKSADAKSAAAGFPEFNIIVCKTKDDSDAPAMPTVVNDGKTMICEVGQKGQNVGVVGVFKEPAGIKMYYQKVVMTDEFETPEAEAKTQPVLKLLQEYSDTVRDLDYLSQMPKTKLHAVQVRHKAAAFVGDTACAACHAAETAAILKTKHVQAYDALAKVAKHPVGRQFDGECIVCHTVGYEYKTGYLNEKTTPQLKNVQCESCHGPASLHVAEENAAVAKKLKGPRLHLADLSPWKIDGKGMLPSPEKFAAMVAEKDESKRQMMMAEGERRVFNSVYQTCAKCHDPENDPHFKLEVYWPKVAHTGLSKPAAPKDR